MRVAIFTETFLPKIDGIVTVVCLLLDHLHKRGVEFMVVAPHLGGHLPDYKGHPVVRVRGTRFPLYPELSVGPPGPRTYAAIKDFNPDIMHFIHPLMVGSGGMVMAKRLRKPTLVSFHLDMAQMSDHFGVPFMKPLMWEYTRWNFNACDYALAPSKLVQQNMVHKGFRNVGLWKRGVDAEKFHPGYRNDAMRDKLSNGQPDKPILLYVGRLSYEKKVQHLRPVLDAFPQVHLAIIGDGPYRAELERIFAGTSTTFMGYMTGEALSQAYASADIFTFTSAMESFGLVLTEAMASGLPVVTSLVGGAKDIIQPGVNGYTYPVGDIEGLIAGVRAILAGKREEMGRAARAFAETQTWDAMMDEVIAAYEALIARQVPDM
ncbi:MAG: glycosyltransferase family 4 protein [Anaerolineales bacterium]